MERVGSSVGWSLTSVFCAFQRRGGAEDVRSGSGRVDRQMLMIVGTGVRSLECVPPCGLTGEQDPVGCVHPFGSRFPRAAWAAMR